MADEPEDDVFELEDEVSEEAEEQQEEADTEGLEADDEEDVVGFGDFEAAPASEESSTFREVRGKLRDAQREIAQLRQQIPAKQKVEVGPRPTIADCDYDEDRFHAATEEWFERKAQADRENREAEEIAEKSRQETLANVEAYKADRAKLKVKDFDEAEKAVYAALGDGYFGLLMNSDKRAELVYALYHDADKLEQLSKLEPVKAAMMVGRLEGQVNVKTRRATPSPDRPLRGGNTTVSTAASDRELASLKAKAEKTGDYSSYFAAKRRMAN